MDKIGKTYAESVQNWDRYFSCMNNRFMMENNRNGFLKQLICTIISIRIFNYVFIWCQMVMFSRMVFILMISKSFPSRKELRQQLILMMQLFLYFQILLEIA